LATPQRAARLVRPGGKRADNSSGSCPSQWSAGRFCCKLRHRAPSRPAGARASAARSALAPQTRMPTRSSRSGR